MSYDTPNSRVSSEGSKIESRSFEGLSFFKDFSIIVTGNSGSPELKYTEDDLERFRKIGELAAMESSRSDLALGIVDPESYLEGQLSVGVESHDHY